MSGGIPFKIIKEKEKTFEDHRNYFNYVDDLNTWRLFKNGDEAAFIYIYKTYFEKLFQLGYQITNDKDLIKDCIQDLFIELREKRKRLSDTDSIRLYLFKAFRRKVIRHQQRQMKLYNKNISLEAAFPICLSIEEKIINRQMNEHQLARLNKAIQSLTAQQREIIYHFYYENLSYKEIADLMGFIHIKSARNLLYKVLDKLRGVLISLLCLILLIF